MAGTVRPASPAAGSASPSGFDHLNLHPKLARGLRAARHATPRPIQAETLPAALEGQDILGLAQTGTGKTAAFAIPILEALLARPAPGPTTLVLAPTRELATQIDAEIRSLARFTKIQSVTVFGGVPQGRQASGLRRRPEIVVGCPGRVLDLLRQRVLHLDRIEMLVLDEADHMFDMGFLPDIRRILAALPKKRQNLFFSATMPSAVRGLAREMLRDPKVAELSHSTPAETVEHALYPVSEGRKRELLEQMLGEAVCESAIVFTRTKHRARRLAQQLVAAGHRAVGLQGNMSQGQRDRAMRGFRDRRFDVLVATDIAARGIDVTGVSHVINFDVPMTPEAYTHRIGRTGRSEQRGQAATFVTAEDRAWVRATERMIGEPIARRTVAGFEGEAMRAEARPRRSGSGPGPGRAKRPRSGESRPRRSGPGGGRPQHRNRRRSGR